MDDISHSNGDDTRLDTAARAGWLYFVAGRTQGEIAKILRVSRPTAQRLVSLCLVEKLVTFQFHHPIASCMEIGDGLARRYKLRICDVVPSDPLSPASLKGVADRASLLLERTIARTEPVVIALGTGRAMRATVDRVLPAACPRHKVVSLVGTISPEGSASPFDAAGRLADVIGASHYPMPLPVLLPTRKERDFLLELSTVRRIRELADAADLSLVGIGNIGSDAPLRVDGFLSKDEINALMRFGAVGEIVGWAFNADGQILEGKANQRVSSVLPRPSTNHLVAGVAIGGSKVSAVQAALRGGLINGLVTDELTALKILKE